MVPVEQIAKTCHTVHVTYCRTRGLPTQPDWDEVDVDHKDVVRLSVFKILQGKIKSEQESHANFLENKTLQGWKYGVHYSIEDKTNPRLVPFEELSITDKTKEVLFFATVKSFM